MTKMIAQLWSGNFAPVKHLGDGNSEIKQLESLMQRNVQKLEENLNDIQKELLEKYNDCMTEYLVVACEQAYCDGFCAGTRITAEAMTGAEKLL